MKFDANYITTRRGILRIAMIIIGFVISSMLCGGPWYGGKSCFNEGRLGGVSAANFIFVIVNIIFFILCLLSMTNYQFERFFSLAGAIVFAVCAVLMGWYVVHDGFNHTTILVPTALVIVQFFLFLWDWQILRGEA